MRRSPGGSTPYSRRSRPLEPPSSATVTIAVRSRVTRRNADNDANRPCPPPRATTWRLTGRPRPAEGADPASTVGGWLLTSEIAMTDLHFLPVRRQPGSDLLRYRYATVLAAGTADGDRDEVLAASFVAGQRDFQCLEVGAQEVIRPWLAEHVVA